jgi:hypothetical protein
LLDERERLQAPAVAARERWETMHDRLRRANANGDPRAYARLPLDASPLGIISPLPPELFPEPGKLRIDLAYGANGERFPAEVVFVRADLEQRFPATGQSLPAAGGAADDSLDRPGPGRTGYLSASIVPPLDGSEITEPRRVASIDTIREMARGLADLTHENLENALKPKYPGTPRQLMRTVMKDLQDAGEYRPRQGPRRRN